MIRSCVHDKRRIRAQESTSLEYEALDARLKGKGARGRGSERCSFRSYRWAAGRSQGGDPSQRIRVADEKIPADRPDELSVLTRAAAMRVL